MISDDELIAMTAKLAWPRKLAHTNTAGGVAASLVAESGEIYHGVCIDTNSSLGFCAEHSAAAAMILAGETRILKAVAIWHNNGNGSYVIPPCGRCRELMKQINEDNLDAEIILGPDKKVKLRELLPYHGGAALATHG